MDHRGLQRNVVNDVCRTLVHCCFSFFLFYIHCMGLHANKVNYVQITIFLLCSKDKLEMKMSKTCSIAGGPRALLER